ncbi:hypothetical protein ABZX85_09270 [Streptomyces sp. NPDC004539]|uniref:hypothetical protein n=1 Tax=Streptomyces sp. NPDC004539 TaxID=3154280 RepID=UPI0033BE7478
MHVVIAWWDRRRTAETRTPSGKPDVHPAGPASCAGEFPGLCTSRWLTDPGADRQGLALIWDSLASADLSLPTIAQRMFGCAPSHRWGFDFDDTAPSRGDVPGLPIGPELLLRL